MVLRVATIVVFTRNTHLRLLVSARAASQSPSPFFAFCAVYTVPPLSEQLYTQNNNNENTIKGYVLLATTKTFLYVTYLTSVLNSWRTEESAHGDLHGWRIDSLISHDSHATYLSKLRSPTVVASSSCNCSESGLSSLAGGMGFPGYCLLCCLAFGPLLVVLEWTTLALE